VGRAYGALPLYTVEGKPPLAQSNAILRLIGSQHGLMPADPWESARHEGVMCAVEEMRTQISATNRLTDAAEKKRAREALATGPLPVWAGQIEEQIVGPFVGGSQLSVADLKVFVLMGTLLKGTLDHVAPEIFKPFPKLLALVEAVKTHPKVVAWNAR